MDLCAEELLMSVKGIVLRVLYTQPVHPYGYY
jgi:hypothetical protein